MPRPWPFIETKSDSSAQRIAAGFSAERPSSYGPLLDRSAAMMRLCCLSLSFKPEFAAKQMDDLKFIDLCAMLELDGVDFNMSSLASLEKDHLKKVKKACLERGLSIACVGVSNDFGRPAEEQEAVEKKVREGIDTAQFLGAPLVRLFAGTVKTGQKRDDVWKR